MLLYPERTIRCHEATFLATRRVVVRRAMMGVLAALTLGAPHAVPAQIAVFDAAAVAKLVTQARQQLQQITIARQQLQTQIDNMRKLATPPWRTINSTMARVDLLTQQGAALAYTLANIDAQFGQIFPGWQLSGTMAADMRLQNERTLATLRGALNAANATAAQFSTAAANIQAIKARLGGITSAQQAAELNGVIGVQTTEELTLLRQQLAAMQSAQLVVQAAQVNHDLQAAAFQQRYDAAAQVRRPPPARRTISGWSY
jgi:P-type conjugative transfer protein TrbJ